MANKSKKDIILLIITLVFCFYITEYISMKIYSKRLSGRGIAKKLNILVIGDSQGVFFPSGLRYELLSHYNFINDSESGTGPDLYLAKINLLNKLYKPKVIIVPICVDNDILCLRSFVVNPQIERIKLYFAKRFFIYHLIRKAYISLKCKRFAKAETEVIDNNLMTPNPYIKEIVQEYPHIIADNLLIRGEMINKSWDIMESIIAEMASLAQKQRVSLILIAIPSSLQINDKYKSFYKNYGFIIPAGIKDAVLIQQRLEKNAKKYNILFLDPLPEFRRIDCGNSNLYYFNDLHLNKKGQGVLEDIIIKFLNNKVIKRPFPK